VTAGDQVCPPAPPGIEASDPAEAVTLVLRYLCPVPAARLSVRYRLFFDLDPGHRNLGRLVLPHRAEPFVFDRSMAWLDVDTTGDPATTGRARFGRMVWLGLEHILGGYDHLLFVLALLIRATRLSVMVKVVTAFTVGHSLTLGLAGAGILALPPPLVEIAIAATIAWVAVENVLARGGHHRWLLAGGFGLIHGLGFYGALSARSLEEAGVVGALLGFNLGVEVGQLTVVALAWGPLVWWARRPWYEVSARIGSAAILAVALGWVVERAVAR
jgi:hypothetical protein